SASAGGPDCQGSGPASARPDAPSSFSANWPPVGWPAFSRRTWDSLKLLMSVVCAASVRLLERHEGGALPIPDLPVRCAGPGAAGADVGQHLLAWPAGLDLPVVPGLPEVRVRDQPGDHTTLAVHRRCGQEPGGHLLSDGLGVTLPRDGLAGVCEATRLLAVLTVVEPGDDHSPGTLPHLGDVLAVAGEGRGEPSSTLARLDAAHPVPAMGVGRLGAGREGDTGGGTLLLSELAARGLAGLLPPDVGLVEVAHGRDVCGLTR